MAELAHYAAQHGRAVEICRGGSPELCGLWRMPLTLRHLVSTPDLGLRLLTTETTLDRAISWVHVSELRDPTPFLSGGELLLTTGLTFQCPPGTAEAAAEADSYVQRLSASAVLGVGFGVGLSHDAGRLNWWLPAAVTAYRSSRCRGGRRSSRSAGPPPGRLPPMNMR